MAIKLSQSLKQTQNLMMTPQLQQSIKMLTLNHSEITDLISNELIENPLLEDSRISEGESPKEEDIYNASLEKGTLETDPDKLLEKNLFEKNNESFDWQGYMEASGDSKPISTSGQGEREESFSYENIVSQGITLAEHLLWQLRMEELTPEDWKIADFIIGNINDEGYLEISSEEIAKELQTSPEKVFLVLERIQKLDPIGCGSRDLKECLLVQANILGILSPLLEKIIKFHFKDLENKKFEVIANSCGKTEEEVINSADLLNQLYPKPGLLIAPSETQYIIPDVFVYEVGGDFKVKINDDGIPKLNISKTYLSLIKPAKKMKT